MKITIDTDLKPGSYLLLSRGTPVGYAYVEDVEDGTVAHIVPEGTGKGAATLMTSPKQWPSRTAFLEAQDVDEAPIRIALSGPVLTR